jgi:hypothetical protein
MLKILFWLLLLFFIYLLARQRLQKGLRRWRGLPEPEPKGPKTVTLVIIALVLVYGLLISYRLYTSGLDSLY